MISQPYINCKKLLADTKYECLSCRNFRSFSILDRNGICGLCIEKQGDQFKCIDQTRSYWYECKECISHYAVEDVDGLKISAKCHFCRKKQIAPTSECNQCKNKFVNDYKDFGNDWICPICISGH